MRFDHHYELLLEPGDCDGARIEQPFERHATGEGRGGADDLPRLAVPLEAVAEAELVDHFADGVQHAIVTRSRLGPQRGLPRRVRPELDE